MAAKAIPTPLPDKLVDVPAVVKLFGVNRRTIMRWIEEGTLPEPIQVGRKLHWRPEAIAALLVPREHAA